MTSILATVLCLCATSCHAQADDMPGIRILKSTFTDLALCPPVRRDRARQRTGRCIPAGPLRFLSEKRRGLTLDRRAAVAYPGRRRPIAARGARLFCGRTSWHDREG